MKYEQYLYNSVNKQNLTQNYILFLKETDFPKHLPAPNKKWQKNIHGRWEQVQQTKKDEYEKIQQRVAYFIYLARKNYPNETDTQNCILATKYLLPFITLIFPDAESKSFDVASKNQEYGIGQHMIITFDKGNYIIDTQLKQFQKELDLPDDFVKKGFYDLLEYEKYIQDLNELIKRDADEIL